LEKEREFFQAVVVAFPYVQGLRTQKYKEPRGLETSPVWRKRKYAMKQKLAGNC